ncbi:Fibromodulin [Liparis tanakae]|uniref:Fibromodulin n=1 Tax=Liparis tanakae TaxID=230148 RepID=A0A4Z2G6L8_9TELE|nr:Fibromodulin [Liparis tanakae]
MYCDGRNLQHVPHIPSHVKSIKDLRLGHNEISKVLPELFEGMADLAALQLRGNATEDAGGVSEGLKSLTVLDMRENCPRKIPDNLPEALQELDLELTDIDGMPEGFLTTKPKLQFVRLAQNQLADEELPSNVFNVNTLDELVLSFNRLEKIPVVSRNLENHYLHADKIKGTAASLLR